MEYIAFAGVAIIAAVLAVILKQHRTEYALVLSVSAGVILLVFAMRYVSQLTDFTRSVSSALSLPNDFLPVLFKVLGIAYLAQFASDACRDAGENGLASKVELIGKAAMLAAALPVLEGLLDMISSLIS